MKSLIISIGTFLLLSAAMLFLLFMYLTDMPPRQLANDIYTQGRLFLYKQDMIKKLSREEMTRLYQVTCTRQCHSKDVIEDRPRTALEWEWIVTRMKAPDRAGISDRHADAITRYLQEHYLSNVPTVLPAKTMRFIKQHLWKSDFGDSDLYLDIIYIPRAHLSLLPYLVSSNMQKQKSGATFIVYINTHQGTIPPWNLAEMSTLHDGNGNARAATGWEILYEDGQNHHKQGILTFPVIDEEKPTIINVAIHLPGMRERIFQWPLPIASFSDEDNVED